MNSLNRILDISSRLEQLESSAEWIARETVHCDSGVSQAGTLISVLADEIREKLFSLVQALEEERDLMLQ